jgi:hypothetical protein
LPFYAEREGAWVLDVDGAIEKSKLDEFRNTNVALLKERDDLKKRFEGINPEQVRALADEKRKLEEEALLNGSPHPGPLPNAEREKVEKVVENRVKALKTDFDKQLASVVGERDALNGRLVANQIDPGRELPGTRKVYVVGDVVNGLTIIGVAEIASPEVFVATG